MVYDRHQLKPIPTKTGWWFRTCFPYIGNDDPNWLSYFSEGLKPPTSFNIEPIGICFSKLKKLVQQLQGGAPFTSSLSRMIPIMDLHITMNHPYHGLEISPMFVDFVGFKRLFFMVHKPVFFFVGLIAIPIASQYLLGQISIFKHITNVKSPSYPLYPHDNTKTWLAHNLTMLGPQMIAKLVKITSITMVYDTYH